MIAAIATMETAPDAGIVIVATENALAADESRFFSRGAVIGATNVFMRPVFGVLAAIDSAVTVG